MDTGEIISTNLKAWMNSSPDFNTLKKVSVKARVGFGTVQRAWNGKGNTTIQNLESIAAVFKRRPEDLLRVDYGSAANITPMPSAREPDALPPRLAELLELARQINETGQIELLGQARMLAHLYPKAKANRAN
jgi:hypothetical protein